MKWKLQSVSLEIIMKLVERCIVFISSSSEKPEYSDNSSVISSVKISWSKQFSNW